MDHESIGQTAKRAGVGIETIRFYERKGLIAPPPRRASGYRQYPAETVDRLRFIKRAKDLGFSLKEIGELLALRVTPGTTCGHVKRRAETKIADIDGRIRALRRMRRALDKLTKACDGKAPIRDCPILESLDDGKPS